MKKGVGFLTGVLVGALMLGGCQSGAEGEPVAFSTAAETEAVSTAAETAAEQAPMEQVEGTEAFSSLPVSLGAPEGAENVEYYLIDGTVAEVNFVENGAHYSFRGGQGEEDVSGVYETLSQEALTASGVDLTAEIRTTASGGRLAAWTDGVVRYSLYTSSPVEVKVIQPLTEELIRITEAGGAVGRQQVENLEGLSALGIPMAEPEDAEEISYYTLQGTTVEIRFTWEDASFLFRGAEGTVEPGAEEAWQEETGELRLTYGSGELTLSTRQAENGARDASWQVGNFAYHLYTAGPLEQEDWEDICAQAADTTQVE